MTSPSSDDRSPFHEDSDAWKLARSLNFTVARTHRKVKVTDPHALAEAGYTITKPKPDYAAIVKAIDAGQIVPGAELGGMEYVLRPAGDSE